MSQWPNDEDESDGLEDPDESDQDAEGDAAIPRPCPYCGREIYEDAERCPCCGRYVVMEPGGGRGRAAWLIVAAALALLAVMIWVLLLR